MVKYEDFGAVGDGITNDFEAILKAHEYANKTCQKVRAQENKTYYISATYGKTAIIKTDTDWTGATFIFDDANLSEQTRDNRIPIFQAVSDYDSVVLPADIIDNINKSGGIDKETVKKIDTGLNYPALLNVIDEEHRRFIRYGYDGNTGRAQTELILVDEYGNIDENTPFLLSYEHVSYITARRADDKPITISGGKFITKAPQQNKNMPVYRSITISRNNVTVKGVDHRIEGEQDNECGPTYAAFIYVLNAANVLIEDSVFQSHKYYNSGTYDLLIEFTINVTLHNCTQHNFILEGKKFPSIYDNYWGIMGSNYSKNLVYENCTLTRFDAHAALYNARISGCRLGTISVTGGGRLLVENTEVMRHDFITLRSDFGSTFDGEIILKNVRQTSQNPKLSHVIGIVWVNHDFGYECKIPSVTIDGFTTDSGQESIPLLSSAVSPKEHFEEAHLKVFSNGEKNKNPYVPPKKLSVKNSNVPITLIDHAMFSDTEKEGLQA